VTGVKPDPVDVITPATAGSAISPAAASAE
jgi:hypothetical protein